MESGSATEPNTELAQVADASQRRPMEAPASPKVHLKVHLIDPSFREIGKAVLFHACLFLGLLIAAFTAMRLVSLPSTNVTVVWIPAGLALLALRTRHGRACIPTVLLAQWAIIALANDYSFFSFRPWSLLMAAANTAGPAIAAEIWRKWIFKSPFTDPNSFLKFIVGVAILPALLTTWVIPAVIWAAGYLPDLTLAGFFARVGSITLSSTLSVFLIVPIAYASWSDGVIQRPAFLVPAHVLNLVVALLIAFIGFHVSPAGLYLAIPFALVSVVLCGSRGFSIGLLAFLVYGLVATRQGFGPFAGPYDDPVFSLFEMAAAALCLGVTGYYSGLTLHQLRRHRKELENVVAVRTSELQESDERYRLATEAVSEGIFDWQEGRAHSFYNATLRRKLGNAIYHDQLSWLAVWRMIHPQDRRDTRDTLREIVYGQAEVFSVDGRLRTTSGEWCWFRARGKVISRDDRKRALRVIGTFNDIHLEKQRLLDLAREREQADSRERAKDTFLANMSHEIRTPMHAMLGFAQILDSSSLDPKQRECVDAILNSGELLLELLNDLLDLSRIEAGAIELSPVVVNFPHALRHTLKLFESQAQKKNLTFDLHLADNVPQHLLVDRLRVHQVIANLLSNAIKFTSHGKVEMRVRATLLDEPASPPTWRISAEVIDTGIGITPEQVNRLFNPFVQADSSITRRFGGSGLGLVISQRLCELMGGTISVTSKKGQGSAFTAVFIATAPAFNASQIKQFEAKNQLIPIDTSRDQMPSLRVLVVEDNQLNRRLAGMMLQRLGHYAEFAENGREALETLAAQTFDVVLMDLQMPELDGFGTTREIRQRERQQQSIPRLPIIALTANAENAERERCLAVGMDGFLTKPLDLKTFKTTLERVHEQFRTRPAPPPSHPDFTDRPD